MSNEVIFPAILRYVHIASGMLAIGGPFFVRFALMPAASECLDQPTHQKLRESINSRWRMVVYIVITLFILTGAYNFLVPTRINGVLITARWKDFSPEDKRLYHMLFGIKVLAAFFMFFLASALAGRTAAFAPIRKNARRWVTVFLVLAAVVLGCSIILRYLPSQPPRASNLPIAIQ